MGSTFWSFARLTAPELGTSSVADGYGKDKVHTPSSLLCGSIGNIAHHLPIVYVFWLSFSGVVGKTRCVCCNEADVGGAPVDSPPFDLGGTRGLGVAIAGILHELEEEEAGNWNVLDTAWRVGIQSMVTDMVVLVLSQTPESSF